MNNIFKTLDESKLRIFDKIYHDLGNDLIEQINDKHINEIMLNPDGKIWIDSSEKGLIFFREIEAEQALAIIYGIAGLHKLIVSYHYPRLEAQLPVYKLLNGERFTAQIPPVVKGPSFSIRKKPNFILTLDKYIQNGRMNEQKAQILKQLVKERKNILVCGGPGTGKTTVTNSLIDEAVKCDANQRFILLEDLPELQCSALNHVALLTSENVSMNDLLRTAMRMRPDRILIGEVRGSEVLDMLKAWNTGCPGGICTIHANGGEEAIQRVLDLAMEAGLTNPPVSLVMHTIDAIVCVSRKDNKPGFVNEILTLKAEKNGKFIFEKMA